MKKFLCYDTNDAASGKIEVDNRGMLKPNSTVPSGSAPYKQLVTDGTGTAKWEDRLAYEGSRAVVSVGDGVQFVKVADEVPSWASVDASTKVWMSNGSSLTVTPKDNTDCGNGSFAARFMVFFITTDNFKFNGLVFPEKGVYFIQTPDFYISGIASADSDTPEITWDGSLYTIKQIDEKFIPKTNPLILYVFVDGLALKNNDKREPVHATVEEIRQAFLGAGVYTTPATDDVGELGSLSQVIYFDPASATIATKGGTYTTNAPS